MQKAEKKLQNARFVNMNNILFNNNYNSWHLRAPEVKNTRVNL